MFMSEGGRVHVWRTVDNNRCQSSSSTFFENHGLFTTAHTSFADLVILWLLTPTDHERLETVDRHVPPRPAPGGFLEAELSSSVFCR